jgi:indolepyruvate ferredoxin oxidoreductase, beta subunit
MNYDIFFVGVGGQGILTIGEVLAEAAHSRDLPASFYPSKGMAQRGGFVKAQLRLGRDRVGPNIAQLGADMAVSMEISESLKAVPYIKRGGDFVLYGDTWAPTAVALGKAPYPTLEQVKEQVALAGAKLHLIDPANLPKFQGEPVRANLYILGVILSRTPLGKVFTPADVENVIGTRFKRDVEANRFAFQAGLCAAQEAA